MGWAVIASYKGERKRKDFESEEEAIKFMEEYKKKSGDREGFLIGVVSTKDPFPVDNEKKKPKGKNPIWCPYCREWRIFKSCMLGYVSCTLCGIPTNDFHVSNMNYLWGKKLK